MHSFSSDLDKYPEPYSALTSLSLTQWHPLDLCKAGACSPRQALTIGLTGIFVVTCSLLSVAVPAPPHLVSAQPTGSNDLT